jgi:hypothetical protein
LLLDNKDERGNNNFAAIEKTKVPGSYRVLFYENNATAVDKFLKNNDEKFRSLGDWEDCQSDYHYKTAEKVMVVGSQLDAQKSTLFWSKHFVHIGPTATPGEIATHTFHAPPEIRWQTGVRISYSDAAKAPTVSHVSVSSSITAPIAGSTCMPTVTASTANRLNTNLHHAKGPPQAYRTSITGLKK